MARWLLTLCLHLQVSENLGKDCQFVEVFSHPTAANRLIFKSITHENENKFTLNTA